MAVGGRGHSEWLWREDDLTGLSLGFRPKWNCRATLAHSVPEKLQPSVCFGPPATVIKSQQVAALSFSSISSCLQAPADQACSPLGPSPRGRGVWEWAELPVAGQGAPWDRN